MAEFNHSSEVRGTITVPKGKHLAEVIDFLPHGLIIKDSTGVGATALEIDPKYSKRHSIVCEPLRSIIESKNGIERFAYYGKDRSVELAEYLSKKPEYIKIQVTSELLGRVIDNLKQHGFNPYKDFFLLIDEIDLHQTHSDFRPYLASCIDHYKKFDLNMRALLTATSYDFSDPDLQKERITDIFWDGRNPRSIDLIVCNDIIPPSVELLSRSKNKTCVFLNSIDSILEIINKVGLTSKNTAAFCGIDKNSKAKLGNYYKPFTTNPEHQFNFYTSAYFSGCDIYIKADLITISDVTSPISTLHPAQIKQIGGRLRNNGILNDTLITNFGIKRGPSNEGSKEELLRQAQQDVEWAQTLIGATSYDVKKDKKTRELLRKKEFKDESYSRIDIDGNVVPNYFLIDFKHISQEASTKLYQDQDSMNFFLTYSMGYRVKNLKRIIEPVRIHRKPRMSQSKAEALMSAIKKIESLPHLIDVLNASGSADIRLPIMQKLIDESSSHERKFLEFQRRNLNVETAVLKESKGNLNFLDQYEHRRKFRTLKKGNATKKLVERYFIVGGRYTNKEIFDGMKIIAKALLDKVPTSENKAVRMFQYFYEITRQNEVKSQDQKSRRKVYEVMGYYKDYITGEYW